MTKYCNNCGEPIINENAIVCSNCGKPISKEATFHFDGDSSKESAETSETKTATPYITSAQKKSPFLALTLSFFWNGLGQVYNGRFWKGIFFLFAVPIGSVFLIIPGLIIWIWGMWDAYSDSDKMNLGELPYAEPTVWEIIIFLCIPFIIVFAFLLVTAFFFTALATTFSATYY
jgi:TM2 domain-containing membrane protein YozV/ribosomal protein L37E